MPRKIDISHKTVFFIGAFILSLWIIYLIRDLLIILFMGLILMSALQPLVNVLTKLKLPKALSIGITYIIIIAVLAAILVSSLPAFIEQTNKLIVTLPRLTARFPQPACLARRAARTTGLEGRGRWTRRCNVDSRHCSSRVSPQETTLLVASN